MIEISKSTINLKWNLPKHQKEFSSDGALTSEFQVFSFPDFLFYFSC